MQYIVLPCVPMIISMLIILFQVKSFNDGILLVDPVMSGTYAKCTSSTRHLLSSHCGHLLIIPSCYVNKFFNIWLCIILNIYFFTDCLTAIYYIILLLVYPDICPSSFYSLTCAYHKPGEGRVLCAIQDSHLGLISMT